MKEYKVVIVSSRFPPYYSGAGIIAYMQALRLDEEKNLAFILKCKFRENPGINSDKIFSGSFLSSQQKNVFPFELALSGKRNPKWLQAVLVITTSLYLFVATGFYMLVYNRRYNIVHCSSVTFLSFFSMLWGKILKKKIVLDITLDGADDPVTILKKKHRKLGPRIRGLQFKWADRVNSISYALKKSCAEAGLSPEKLTLITPPVDISRFSPPFQKEKNEIKKTLFGKESVKVILFAGALIKRKGFDITWESFKTLNRLMPDNNFVLAIVGRRGSATDKPSIDDIMSEAGAIGIRKKVKFFGAVEDIERYMKASDYFLFPTRQEGFGIVIIEAMACGVPVIVNNLPGITSTIVNNDVDGFLIGGDKPELYADKIIELDENKSLYNFISDNAVKTVKERYSAQIIHNKYKQVYNEILTENKKVN